MPNGRNIVFISHASPEDNDFTIWLASRLNLLGYEVWIDKNQLVGGEKFWEEIDQTIRNNTIKFLLVYSKSICQKDQDENLMLGKLKDGIYKEYSLAESIGKQCEINDFILLLNLDDSAYNLFIGADRFNQISFNDNWADGFRLLEMKLNKDLIPKSGLIANPDFVNWYENKYLNISSITKKNELYYSNWWTINKLPEYYYIYQFENEEQSKTIYEQDSRFPFGKISNNLTCFEPDLSFEVDYKENKLIIKPSNVFKIKIADVLLGFESIKFPTLRDAENHLKNLLKRVFHLIMKNRGMFWYELANKRLAYFYTPANLTRLKVKFVYPYRPKKSRNSKTKNLIGRLKNLGNWHFAVSVKPILTPIVAFSLKSHITFTTDGFLVWKDSKGEINKNKIHSHRRAKGKRLFNEEWRDMLLAFINGIKKDGSISIALSSSFHLDMKDSTELFWADFGYFDPKDKSRQGLLSMYEIQEEQIDEEEDLEESE
jgi:hypothetical protein